MKGLRIEKVLIRSAGPFSFDVSPTECVALTGPSGIGKSLLLRALADMEPFAGKVFLDGIDSAAMPAPKWRQAVGLLPAESAWWRDAVGDHFGAIREEWFEKLGFEPDVLTWSVSRLSSGERQRLAFLRLICNGPRALLLDEPTTNLDPANVERVEYLVSAYRNETGAAVIWVGHDPEQFRRVSGRRFVLTRAGLMPA